MSDESIEAPTTSDNSFASGLNYIGNKVRIKFAGSCLKQDKIAYTHGKIKYLQYLRNKFVELYIQ